MYVGMPVSIRFLPTSLQKEGLYSVEAVGDIKRATL